MLSNRGFYDQRQIAPGRDAETGGGSVINTEYQILCITLLSITVAILVFCLWGVQVVRKVAVWIGNKVADLGGGGPR